MPIQRLLKNSQLEPDRVKALNCAFTLALRSLGLVDRNDPICDLVAQEVIDIGAHGMRDPQEIAKAVVDRYSK
jgi:hypothetical protein